MHSNGYGVDEHGSLDEASLQRNNGRLSNGHRRSGLDNPHDMNLLGGSLMVSPLLRPGLSRHSSTHTVTDLHPLRNLPGFVGEMIRDQARELLMGLPDGTYMIRLSLSADRQGLLSISFVSGIPRHIRIEQRLQPDTLGNTVTRYYLSNVLEFASVEELITHYSSNSLREIFNDIDCRLNFPYIPMPGSSIFLIFLF
ncbi:Guanine nucleotide exchange factor vav3 [Cichlidogyrus casuarinus]|uniref:Guanine nucleotide exchange factor vav3 n=1 Tax=Cichlidogyrus casuarinus TaxID=1844966 RepID=A0ABD2Q1J7_9PLAT